ncbi:MAG: acyltransferase [Planctomycetes bacterium]|nr:acyltransferase [Planctomycetota bacterium]
MATRPELLPALTSLRFPATVSAVLFHVWGLFLGPGGERPPITIWHLWAGLSFFFVMSGFILTYVYLNEFREPTRRGVWNYLVARLARIYPVHVLAFLIILPLDYPKLVRGDFGNPIICVATYLGLGHAWLPLTANKAYAFNSPSWSLSADVFFYLMLPLLIPALTRGPVWRRVGFALLALAPWGLATTDLLFGTKLLGSITPFRYPPVRLADFVTGVLLAMWWHHRRAAGTVPAPVRSVGRATAVEVGAVLLTVAWMWGLVLAMKTPKWLMASGWCGVYLPPYVLLLWVLARGEGLVSRVLSSRPLAYLGDISFTLYMLHQPVISYFYFKGHLFGGREWPWWCQWAAVFAVSLLAAAACFHLVEVPARDWLRKRLTIRAPKAAPAEAPQVEPPARRAA